MILDRLENAALYSGLGERIALALDYLRREDFSQIANGRYELDGDRVFALVQRYAPKPPEKAVWESHRQYIDVQYMAAGQERMGYTPLSPGLNIREALDSQDAYLYDAEGDLFQVPAGSFAIFAPQDVHAPGLAADALQPAEEVCKVVVKCRVR